MTRVVGQSVARLVVPAGIWAFLSNGAHSGPLLAHPTASGRRDPGSQARYLKVETKQPAFYKWRTQIPESWAAEGLMAGSGCL